MPILEWSKEFETGIGSLDKQHRDFCKHINELYDLLKHGRSRPAVEEKLSYMSRLLKDSYLAEEKLMAEHNFPGLSSHKAEHENFEKGFADLASELTAAAAKPPLAYVAKRAAIGWFVNHLLRSDKEMAEFIKACKESAA